MSRTELSGSPLFYSRLLSYLGRTLVPPFPFFVVVAVLVKGTSYYRVLVGFLLVVAFVVVSEFRQRKSVPGAAGRAKGPPDLRTMA